MSELKKDSECKANTTNDWRMSVKKKTTEEFNYYQYMLDHDILTDCTFVVGPEDGETREFKAHRLHVARVSAVFEAMLLRGEMVEAKTGHVRISDLTPNTFNLLFKFIYGKKLKMTSFQEMQDLAFAAHKYQINALIENCATQMCSLITADNIWTAIETADLLQNQRLKAICLQVLQCDTLRCITNAEFLKTSEKNVALLLEQDELNMDELSLLNVIVQWARHAARQRGLSGDESGVRTVLKPRLLSFIRFLTMSQQQFFLGTGLAGWLTDDEKSLLSECLRTRNFSTIPQNLCHVAEKRRNVTCIETEVQTLDSKLKRKLICKREKIGLRPNAQAILCDSVTNSYRMLLASLIFKVNSRCTLLGFQFASRFRAGLTGDPTAFSATNPVYDEYFRTKTFSFNHTLSTDFNKTRIGKQQNVYRLKMEFNSTNTIMFDQPIRLLCNNWFGIEVEVEDSMQKPPMEYPNPLRARSVYTAAGVEFIFCTEEQEGYYTSVYDGIFENLIFTL